MQVSQSPIIKYGMLIYDLYIRHVTYVRVYNMCMYRLFIWYAFFLWSVQITERAWQGKSSEDRHVCVQEMYFFFWVVLRNLEETADKHLVQGLTNKCSETSAALCCSHISILGHAFVSRLSEIYCWCKDTDKHVVKGPSEWGLCRLSVVVLML